jgi:hypothetical protein
MATRAQGYDRQRVRGTRRFRRRVVIATEGTESEPEYFDLFRGGDIVVQVTCVRGGGSPRQVLQRMHDHLGQYPLGPEDQAWLVIDRDAWTEAQLTELHAWTTRDQRCNFALSNPKFEYWLLLHFEDGNGIANAREVDERLHRHLPHFNKHIRPRDFPGARISEAVVRAKLRDHPPTTTWPQTVGTTVYRIVTAIRSNPPGPT